MMIPTQLYVGPNQENRIMKALKRRRGCRIKERKGAANSRISSWRDACRWEINEYYIQAQRF